METSAPAVSNKKHNIITLSLFAGGIILYTIWQFTQNFNGNVIYAKGSALKFASLYMIFGSIFLFALKRKRYIIVNIALLILLVLGLETVCFALLGMPDKYVTEFPIADLPPDHIGTHMGPVPWADSVYQSVKVVNNDTSYNVRYTIDNECKRATPGYDTARKKHALFFGCSIAFGEGLSDNQTVAYAFQDTSKEYNAYNFAYSGYGTNQMLARLEYKNLNGQVKEKDGAAFYIFFWDHIRRAISSMDRHVAWTYASPYFTMEDGKLVRKGVFKTGRPVISWLYEHLYQSSIIQYFKIDFPSSLNDYHFDLITEMIKVSKQRYKEQFGSDKFYVVMYPGYKYYTEDEMKRFKHFLNEKKIDILDLTELFPYSDKYTLKGDPHPNAEANKLVAVELLKRINGGK